MMRFLAILIPGLLITVLSAHAVAEDDAAVLAELIDRHIQSRHETLNLSRVAQADDAEFLRRVYLDLHGVVPSTSQAAEFLDSAEPSKRAELIDNLLNQPRMGDHFADLWRRRLISPIASEERQRTERFTSWLADRFNRNDGWDRITFDLLTATGKLEENPAVTYLIEGRGVLGVTDLTDLTSRYFLGVRLNCAQCHDHPHVAWKRQDYWGMAAFFAQIQTPGRQKVVYEAGVRDASKMTLASLRDADMIEGFQPLPPTFLGGAVLSPDHDQPFRVALARWITSRDNPYFARAMVNRIWWNFFGRGLVNPVDDMHAKNAPSHPELLEVLTNRFAETGFDQKLLCKAIVRSRTYQQTSRPGEDPDPQAQWYARMSIKSLSAEQLYDSLVQILGPPGKAPGIDLRLGARHEFSRFFGGDGDAEPLKYERGIPHLLRLMNSPQFAGHNIANLVARIDVKNRPADEVVDDLFLTVISRRPTTDERRLWSDLRSDRDQTSQNAYRELVWALLMSSEFALNH